MATDIEHTYTLEITNGRVKVKIDGMVMVTFNQIDFKGYYSFKDDSSLYCVDFYLANGVAIETSYKTKQVWVEVLKLLDREL